MIVLRIQHLRLSDRAIICAQAITDIREQFIEQIAPAGPVPQMVVGIYDRQIRLEDWFTVTDLLLVGG